MQDARGLQLPSVSMLPASPQACACSLIFHTPITSVLAMEARTVAYRVLRGPSGPDVCCARADGMPLLRPVAGAQHTVQSLRSLVSPQGHLPGTIQA